MVSIFLFCIILTLKEKVRRSTQQKTTENVAEIFFDLHVNCSVSP